MGVGAGERMNGQLEMPGRVLVWLDQAGQVALGWLKSPAAWSQFGLLVLAHVLAHVLALLVAGRLRSVLARQLVPPEGKLGRLSAARRFAPGLLPLLVPFLVDALTAIGEGVTRSRFGSGDVIGFGKRVFVFRAAQKLARRGLKEAGIEMPCPQRVVEIKGRRCG